MTEISQSALVLSCKFVKNGVSTFNSLTHQQVARHLGKIAFYCLDVTIFCTVLVHLFGFGSSYLNSNTKMYTGYQTLALLLCIFMELKAIKKHMMGFVIATAIVQFGYFLMCIGNLFYLGNGCDAIDITFFIISFLIYFLLTFFTFVLYKVIRVPISPFNLATTVLMRPTMTPVTFTSVLAPQEIDPTNPYYSQSVFNPSLNKTVS